MKRQHNNSPQETNTLPQARKQDDSRSMNDQRRGSIDDTLSKEDFNNRDKSRRAEETEKSSMSAGSNNNEAEAMEDVNEQVINDAKDEDVKSEMKIRSNADKKPIHNKSSL